MKYHNWPATPYAFISRVRRVKAAETHTQVIQQLLKKNQNSCQLSQSGPVNSVTIHSAQKNLFYWQKVTIHINNHRDLLMTNSYQYFWIWSIQLNLISYFIICKRAAETWSVQGVIFHCITLWSVRCWRDVD